MPALSDMEADAIAELVNLGLGLAAASLSSMVHEEVILAVPQVSLVPASEVSAALGNLGPGQQTGVRQHFSGMLSGDAVLLFGGDSGLELIRMMLSRGPELDIAGLDMTSLEHETLLEIGNILLNACLSSLADNLGLELHTDAPRRVSGRGVATIDRLIDEMSEVLVAWINFSVKGHAVHGYVSFLLDASSAYKLVAEVDDSLRARGLDPE